MRHFMWCHEFSYWILWFWFILWPKIIFKDLLTLIRNYDHWKLECNKILEKLSCLRNSKKIKISFLVKTRDSTSKTECFFLKKCFDYMFWYIYKSMIFFVKLLIQTQTLTSYKKTFFKALKLPSRHHQKNAAHS